jgi:hypothetical protein
MRSSSWRPSFFFFCFFRGFTARNRMTNRIGHYLIGNTSASDSDTDRATVAMAFCACITRVYLEGEDFSHEVDKALTRIEREALQVFYHYSVQPPDLLDRL